MKRTLLILLVLLLLLALGSMVLAANGQLRLPWFTADGGGGRSQGGELVLSGTIGQPEAGRPAAGGQFRLRSGYWSGPAAGGSEEGARHLYLPLLQRP